MLLAYRAGETSLEETGTSVEDYGGRLARWHCIGLGYVTDRRFRHGGRVLEGIDRESEEDKEGRESQQYGSEVCVWYGSGRQSVTWSSPGWLAGA